MRGQLRRIGRFLLCSWFLLAIGNGQTPSFEVADVKLNQSGEMRMSVDFQPGAKFSAHNVPMRILIALAYHVRPDAIVGGPGWIGTARYDIVAKGSQTASSDDLRAMVQNLLTERFHLAVHNEQQPAAAYALEVGKGLKAQPSEPAPLSEQRCVPGTGAAGQKHVVCRHLTMALLAENLLEIASKDIDIPVVDQTGITGNFDFQLDWTPAAAASAGPADDAAGPTLFEALDAQLGLKLKRTRLPQPVIVVDRVERIPAGN